MLAGCVAASPRPAGTPAGGPVASRPAPTPARPQGNPFRRSVPLALPGLADVIGAHADQLVRLFGPPRLDIVEGDARKLQFVGPACVLDAYLYPPQPGREAETTYVDARRDDGRDTDRAGCIAALRR